MGLRTRTRLRLPQGTIVVHHDSDWLGEAVVEDEAGAELARLPGPFLVALGRIAFLDEAQHAVSEALHRVGPPVD